MFEEAAGLGFTVLTLGDLLLDELCYATDAVGPDSGVFTGSLTVVASFFSAGASDISLE